VVSTDFSGREVVSVLRDHGYRIVGRQGSHVQLRYEHPVTDEVRTVTVPQYDRIDVSILQRIADQCGVREFRAWCEWIDRNR
jgi:predicted RNA binding protein YcfA (HicA-like mRNA interferase family)